ncbi:hypothetical protein GW17_00058307 [Ensete ventricosum]|nr:hypothetical protein GW17_00058307 [Ensete ventricosum]
MRRRRGGQPRPAPMQGRPPTARGRLATTRASTQVKPVEPERGSRRQRPAGGRPYGQQPTRAALACRSITRKGCRLQPAGATPAHGQSVKGRRPWRCRPLERSRS